MVDVRQGSGGFELVTGGTTDFWPTANSYLSGTAYTTESNAQVTYRTAGTMNNLYANCTAFTSSGSITLRDNATSQTLTVSVSATGVFEDTTHSFSIAAADKVNYETTGSYNLVLLATTFSANTNTAIRLLACANGTNQVFSVASETDYMPNAGYMGEGAITTSDTGVQTTVRATGTISNGIINVTANSGSTGGTLTSRHNAAAGNLSIATSTTTGIKEDTTHTDSVVSGDTIDLLMTQGATSPNETVTYVGCDYTTTAGKVPNIHYQPFPTGNEPISSGTTLWFQMGAGDSTTEAGGGGAGQIKTRDTFLYSTMESYVKSNTIAATSTVVFRANAANTNITYTISSTGTGFFQDTTHTYTAAATDLVVSQATAGTSSGNTLAVSSFVIWASLPVATINFLDTFYPRTMVIEQWL